MPADHVVVPFSRSVWPAAKKSTMSVIVVCEPALNAVVPASEKLPEPERRLAAADRQRAVAAARAIARHPQRAGAAVIVEIERAGVHAR